MDLTQQGLASCIVACTNMIAASSRSHVLINLTVERHLPDGSVTRGMLFFVDLAGIFQFSIAKTWDNLLHDHLGSNVVPRSGRSFCLSLLQC